MKAWQFTERRPRKPSICRGSSKRPFVAPIRY